jgi:hypothetical protein
MATSLLAAGGEQAPLLALVTRVAEATAGLGRADLEQHLRIAIARVVRPATTPPPSNHHRDGRNAGEPDRVPWRGCRFQ